MPDCEGITAQMTVSEGAKTSKNSTFNADLRGM